MTAAGGTPLWREAVLGAVLSVGATKLEEFVRIGAKVRRVDVLLELPSGRKMCVDSYGRCQAQAESVCTENETATNMSEAQSSRSQQQVVRHDGHDHRCSCGTATHTPHETGTCGCVRHMTEAPEVRPDGRWFVDGHEMTDCTLRQQRGYHQHDCGCWSRWRGSTNSVNA